MRIQVLASGSKGNCTYIESSGAKILIDAGITFPRVKRELEKIKVDPMEIDGILISHIHKDHISGLSSLTKKMNAPIFIKDTLFKDLRTIVKSDLLETIEDEFSIGDLTIELVNASHDVPSYGFIISNDKNSIFYLTDTGYINRKYYEKTKNKDVYIIESNHDEKMLMEGSYPYILKQRVLSDHGHLSNRTTGQYLNKTIGDKTKYIILAHLSENNNTPELALEQVKEEIKERNFDEDKIIIAKQYEETELVEIT